MIWFVFSLTDSATQDLVFNLSVYLPYTHVGKANMLEILDIIMQSFCSKVMLSYLPASLSNNGVKRNVKQKVDQDVCGRPELT